MHSCCNCLSGTFFPELFLAKSRTSRAKINVKSIRNECKSYTFSEDSLDIRKSLEKLGLILGEKIDEGSSAFIYLAISTGLSGYGKSSWQGEKGKVHAVKVVKLSEGKEESKLLAFHEEYSLLSSLSHRGIVKVYHYDRLFMVMEYCGGGSLFEALHCTNIKAKNVLNQETEGELISMIDENMPILNLPILMLDIAEALSYIHQHDLAHRDIKSANILLTWDKELERVRAKIADFGSANAVSVVPVRKKTNPLRSLLGLQRGFYPVGSLLWMSPEMLEPPFEEEEVYARADKVDSYALAIVLWECMEWRIPWCGTEVPSRKLVVKKVVKSKSMHLPLPRKATKDFAELITVMLHKDPRKRPTSVEIFERLEDIAGIWDTERAYQQISSYLHINRTTEEYIYKVLSVNASHESTIPVVTSKENVYDHNS